MSPEELYTKLVSEWGEREVYPLEENEVDVLSKSPDAQMSEYDNGDGTITTTLLYKGKKLINTKVTQ